jgi:Rps23 Pro-64 3,4-dihydroxylase Tpa1-like proline 4-hydroxylase
MHDAESEVLDQFPLEQSSLNVRGRERCRNGILNKGPWTKEITSDTYGDLDFIVLEDFLNAEERAILMTCFDAHRPILDTMNPDVDFWANRLMFSHEANAYSTAAGDILSRFQREATRLLSDFYALQKPIYADTVQLVYWRKGMFMPPHADNANPDGSEHGMPWRCFSSVCYLNDDYDGGELYFTALDKYIKPKAGMLVAFTGGFHHEHSVLNISGGDRYTMPAFYSYDPAHADEFIYPELFGH